jgi:drug/metabolite transporter (DMT)-like permease
LHESITPLRGVGVAIMLTSIALMNHYKVSKSKRKKD